MKKVLFLLVALATVACISCKKTETSAPTSAADTTAVTDSATVGDTATAAQVQIPTLDQMNNISDEAVLSALGMTKLRENLTGQNEDTRGNIFYGKDAEVDEQGKITAKGEHAIVVVENLEGDLTGVTIYFSNQNDYNTYLQNNKKGETGQENGLYYVKYNDENA